MLLAELRNRDVMWWVVEVSYKTGGSQTWYGWSHFQDLALPSIQGQSTS